jgi:hypothetical protein
VQYCDTDDGHNFDKSKKRRYRNAMLVLHDAVNWWNSACPDILFIAQLGDLLDGQNNLPRMVGEDKKEHQSGSERSVEALRALVQALDRCVCKNVASVVGNHELYNFNRRQLYDFLGLGVLRRSKHLSAVEEKAVVQALMSQLDGLEEVDESGKGKQTDAAGAAGTATGADTESDGKSKSESEAATDAILKAAAELHTQSDADLDVDSYYSFSPYSGWRFIVLDAYDIGTIGRDPSDERYEQARAILKAKNPNDTLSSQYNWFAGVDGEAQRFVPFNGAVSDRQLSWLRQSLRDAVNKNERVVIMTHIPLLLASSGTKTLLWNYEEVLATVYSDGCRRGDGSSGSIDSTASSDSSGSSDTSSSVVSSTSGDDFGKNVVVAVLAGHDHTGGFATDAQGIHHITFESPLECFGDEVAYSCMAVHGDGRLELQGQGRTRSRTLRFTP